MQRLAGVIQQKKKDWWATDVKVEFDKMKAENPDVIGWIRFDNQDELGINYPILYSGDNQKYLRTDLHGNSHIAECIFLEGLNKSDFSDYYNIIYGHNMNDGSMFGSLKKYKEEGFWKKNQYFCFQSFFPCYLSYLSFAIFFVSIAFSSVLFTDYALVS